MTTVQQPVTAGPVGKERGTGVAILLCIVTFGFYSLYWWYATHKEMKDHSGTGLGGGLGLVLGIFLGFVLVFITASEVKDLYERRGQQSPVSGLTGLWILLPIVGSLIWFVKVNGALNAYWRTAS